MLWGVCKIPNYLAQVFFSWEIFNCCFYLFRCYGSISIFNFDRLYTYRNAFLKHVLIRTILWISSVSAVTSFSSLILSLIFSLLVNVAKDLSVLLIFLKELNHLFIVCIVVLVHWFTSKFNLSTLFGCLFLFFKAFKCIIIYMSYLQP